MRTVRLSVLGVLLASSAVWTQPAAPTGYQLPPKAIVDILDAAPPPQTELSPASDVVALLDRASMPAIADLAQPMLRIAGIRINPKTNGPHRGVRYRSITLKTLADGTERKVTLPSSPSLTWIGFSPGGRRFAFTHTRADGIELWLGETATGAAKPIAGAALNTTLGSPCTWIGEGGSLLCAFVDPSRGAAPAMPAVPAGPNIQEHPGGTAPVRTYQDLLTSAYDEALFDYYATSQLAVVDAASGQRTNVGRAGIYSDLEVSPDSQYILLTRTKRPYSWLVPYGDFAQSAEIWDRQGALVKQVADLPVSDTVPNGGVLPGPRAWRWNAVQPATVVWAEALDGGNPRTRVPHRDKVMTLAAPFSAAPTEVIRTQWRFSNVMWTEAGVAMVLEFDRRSRDTRTWLLDTPTATPRKVWERSSEDAYANPGTPVRRVRASGALAIRQVGQNIYLTGNGSSPQGDRPFLDRFNLRTLTSERVFQTADGTYETVMGVLNDDASSILTRFETRVDPPNVFVRDLKTKQRRAITAYADPAAALKGAKAEMVTYNRKDGIQLRATIYTPPGWTPAQGKLPALLWAYPREFTTARTASQVTGSAHRFTVPGWGTLHLMFLMQGYAIIDDATMPIVGEGETANDQYVEQLVSSAQAAVDKASAMGIVDADRVAVGGHSYGGFMTANLLAHSDIFRAGIARSGAYNRTLTPFGFQNEQRTFWEVPTVYAAMSPFYFAHKINEPILLTHGEADDNSGTFPIQSERLYVAIKGNGGIVRYVTLPHEAHGYAARESVMHVMAEMLNWADQWAKNAKPRSATSQQQ